MKAAIRILSGDETGKDADAAFARTCDPMDALLFIADSAKRGEPLPLGLARWLCQVIEDYRSGAARTMDAAMGLTAKGRAQPRRKVNEGMKKARALTRMALLCGAGATRDQAAALVATVTRYTVEHLTREYAMNPLMTRDFEFGLFCLRPEQGSEQFLREILAEYPDGAHTKQEKAAILRQYKPSSEPVQNPAQRRV